MKTQLKVYGRVDLDGTHKAVIETDSREFGHVDTDRSRFLKLHKAGKICGCILMEVCQGDTNRIWLDRFKQRQLQARDEDIIDIEEIHPPQAKKVELQVPTDFSQQDVARLIGKPVTSGEKTAFHTFSGEPRLIVIGNVKPNDIVTITSVTDIITSTIAKDAPAVPITYKDIGGLSREIKIIREVVEYPLRFPDVFERLGVSQPKGIILHGPPGTGKTLLVKALANEVGAKFYSINGPEIFSMWYGESEKKLRGIFDDARANAPSLILIDELDAIAPKRETVHGELEQRIVTTLLTLMDGLTQLKGVVVIGTTNRVNSIDVALRRGGRFGNEVYIGIPDTVGRKEILEIHTRKMPLSTDVNLDVISEKTVGFVGADIMSLCREAAYNTLRRSFSSDAFEKGQIIPHEGLKINQSDFECALSNVPPSAMKEFLVEIPKVSWDDVGGLDGIKRLLIENISYAITKRDVFRKVGIKPARGILLYGPPGTGKTLLAKAVANQCGANFISIKGSEMRSKWIGESEEKIRFLFAKAREVAPCVIFFDEIDAIASSRGRDTSGVTDTIVNQILSEMDGVESADGVFVMGATNRAELLDPAILRPGRFDYHVEIPLPDNGARMAIFSVHLKQKPIDDIDFELLLKPSEGFSGAEIAEVCREATWEAMRDANFEAELVKVTMDHIMGAIANMRQTKNNFDQSKNIESYIR